MATEVPILHPGGIAVLYYEAEHFSLEELYLHGPKVVRLQLVMGQQRWHFVVCHITPGDALTIEDIITAIRRNTRGDKLLVAGNFNADLANPKGTAHVEEIAAALAAAGLEDISAHFLLRHKSWLRDRCT